MTFSDLNDADFSVFIGAELDVLPSFSTSSDASGCSIFPLAIDDDDDDDDDFVHYCNFSLCYTVNSVDILIQLVAVFEEPSAGVLGIWLSFSRCPNYLAF